MVGRIVGTEECYKNVNIWSSTKKETNWEKEIKICRSRCGHIHSCIFFFTLPGNNCMTISGWQILSDSSCTATERITSKLRSLTQQAFMISVLRVRYLEAAWAGWFLTRDLSWSWRQSTGRGCRQLMAWPELEDQLLSSCLWLLAEASALHWLLARTMVPCHLGPSKGCLCTSVQGRWLPPARADRQSVHQTDREPRKHHCVSGLRHRSYTHRFRHSQWIRSESLRTACTQGEGNWAPHSGERNIE